MATTTTTALSMKLLVDSKAQRVLFAEASKDVVDFLFSLLALPVGTAVKLMGKESMVGCVGNLYGSVEKLDGTYVLPGADKDALLHPAVLSPAASTNSSLFLLPEEPFLLPDASSGKDKKFFKCASYDCDEHVTDAVDVKCPSCGEWMTSVCQYAPPRPSGSSKKASRSRSRTSSSAPIQGPKGFVQGIVTYTVMDNLTVNPMSSISSIAVLNTFAVKDLGALQEKTVQLGYKEGLAILKASLQSKTVLTDVFLGKKLPAGRA